MVRRENERDQGRRNLESLRPLRAVQYTFYANPYYVWILSLIHI